MYVRLWKYLVVVPTILLYLNGSAIGMQSFVALFQTDIVGSQSAKSDVWIEFNKNITSANEFTVCHWIKIRFYNTDSAACLWSYCTIQNLGQGMECLQVCMNADIQTANRDLFLSGNIKLKRYSDIKSMIRMLDHYQHRTWTHLCWSFSSNTGIRKYYQNGKIFSVDTVDVAIDDLALKSSYEMSDSALVFGQEPDSMRGGFSKEEAYLGQLSEFNIWNYTLDDSDIIDMALCKRPQKGNIVAWEKSNWILNNVLIDDIQDPAHFCHRPRQYLIFPEKHRFPDAQKVCEIHGGSLAVPRSDKDSNTILDIVSKHSDKCIESTNSNKKNAAWIGARKINREWYEFNSTYSQGKRLNYTNIPEPRSNPDSDCSFLRHDGAWLEGRKTCTILASLCPVCEIKGNPVFTVRGICTLANYDWNYYLSVDDKNQINFYEGYKSTNIIFDQKSQEWMISSKPEHSIKFLGKLKVNNFTSNHPIGRKKWYIQDYLCKTSNLQQVVAISACDVTAQFTCNSGHCIDIANRCDETKQCLDGSDEKFCTLVKIPPSYSLSNAPRTSNDDQTLKIITKINILNIDSIDSVNMIVTLTMKIILEWFDSRLMFSNLMYHTENIMPEEHADRIWSPLRDMTYENAVIGEVTYDSDYIINIVPIVPERWDVSSPRENRVYNGSYNPLILTHRKRIKFGCTFDVTRFPFDDEKCMLFIKLKQRGNRRISFLESKNVLYSGEAIIDQYAIGEMSSVVNSINDSARFHIVMPMTRIPTNQFLSTFFPSVILWLFGYSTLFIEPTEVGFNNRFMGSGTALLVIATLITAVKSDLPKTSYMKFIDIWFLWHVVSVFAIIVYHIILERRRRYLETATEAENQVLHFRDDDAASLKIRGVKLIENVNKVMIYVFPILTGSFYVVYFCLKLL